MRWQKAARIAIAVGVVAFTLIVFIALRRNKPPVLPESSPRTDPDAVFQTDAPVKYQKFSREGKIIVSIAAQGQATYANGRHKLRQARLTLPDRGGRTLEIESDEMETTSPPEKPGELGTALMNGHVKMTASDGLVVTAAQATYDSRDGMVRVPGAVEFTRGRLKGVGAGATYDEARNVLWLLKDARMSIAADEKGQGAAEGSAGSAGFARAEHYLRMTGSGRIAGEERTLEGDDITVQFSDDDKRVRTVQLRGNSKITGTGEGQQSMAARDIDLAYGEDGKAIQHATLTENASVQLPGTGGAAGRRVAGRNMTMGLAPDGKTVTSLNASERVEVDLPAEGEAGSRRITSSSLNASGAAEGGLRAATFSGNVEYRETRPAAGGTPASERVARSLRLMVETKPGFGEIQQADFRGNVRFEDGATVGEAARGLYRVVEDTLELSPSKGDPGQPPRVSDDRMTVDAGTISIALGTRKLTAESKVRSSMQPAKPDEKGAAAKGRGNGKRESSKLPSMLKADEPVLVNAEKLEYDGTATAVYSGDARLFQGQTTIAGDTITLDDRSGNMTAVGKVRTVMYLDDVDPKTKERKPTQTVGTAHQLVYEDGKRLATYTTGPTADAHLVGAQGDLTAEKIQLFLKPKDNELERAEADVKVTVKEGQRRAKGDHLTYTSSDETYVMNGNPLEVDRFAPGECTRTLGVSLRFRRGDDNLIVDGIPGVTPFNTKPIPCS